MKKVKISVSALLAALLLMFGTMPVFAAEQQVTPSVGTATITMTDEDGRVTEHVFDVMDLVSVEYDANGNLVQQPRISIGSDTIGQGGIRYYYTSTGAHFEIRANTSVTISVSLNVSANVDLGYALKDHARVATYSGISKNPSSTFTLSTGGFYCFFLKNYSSGSITVNS